MTEDLTPIEQFKNHLRVWHISTPGAICWSTKVDGEEIYDVAKLAAFRPEDIVIAVSDLLKSILAAYEGVA